MKIKNAVFCCILLAFFGLVSCSNTVIDSNKEFTVGTEGTGKTVFQDKAGFGLSQGGVYIDSKENFETICNKLNNGFYDNGSQTYNSKAATICRSYDDSFFEDKALIIYEFMAGYHYNYSVENIDIYNEEAIVNIKAIEKQGVYEDLAFSYLFILEIDIKLDVKSENVKGNIIYSQIVPLKIVFALYYFICIYLLRYNLHLKIYLENRMKFKTIIILITVMLSTLYSCGSVDNTKKLK